jgi:hypothetical protein
VFAISVAVGITPEMLPLHDCRGLSIVSLPPDPLMEEDDH